MILQTKREVVITAFFMSWVAVLILVIAFYLDIMAMAAWAEFVYRVWRS